MLTTFPRKNKKEIALVLDVSQCNQNSEKFNIYKILCNNEITNTINYKLEKLWKIIFSQKTC